MKRVFALLMLLCGLLPAARAQVYVDQAPPADWAQRDLMRLTVFRTGESDCMLLENGGECMMIDGGAMKWRDKLYQALQNRGISHLKYFYNTHPHDDHIDGLCYLIMDYGVTADAFLSVFPEDYDHKLHQRALRQAKKAGIPFRQMFNGDTLTLGGVTLRVYRSSRGVTENGYSALTRLEFGDASALLCADITGDVQKQFQELLPADQLKADVIKAPHHGLNPIVSEFLDAVDPDFAVITNYEGDRAEPTANQMKNRKIPFSHSGEGTVTLETDGVDWYITQTLKQF